MENKSIEIAKTMQQQLLAFGKMKVFSWGANSWTAVENGLAFKVQGFKFKGIVKIILTPYDTYNVQFIKAKKVENEYPDIYFDELTNIIDAFVEYTGDNYKQDVEQAIYSF